MKKKQILALILLGLIVLLCGRSDANKGKTRVKRFSWGDVKAFGKRMVLGFEEDLEKGLEKVEEGWEKVEEGFEEMEVFLKDVVYVEARKEFEDVMRKIGTIRDFHDAVDVLMPLVIKAGIGGACSGLCREARVVIMGSPAAMFTSTLIEGACKPLCSFVVKWLEDELL